MEEPKKMKVLVPVLILSKDEWEKRRIRLSQMINVLGYEIRRLSNNIKKL